MSPERLSMPLSADGRRPLAVWAMPRTMSNTFVRLMYERGDHVVLHEPFQLAFWLGPERGSHQYDGDADLMARGETYAQAKERLVGRAELGKPLFIKELPYQLGPYFTPDGVTQFQGSFLLRHPAYSFASFGKLFTADEMTDTVSGFPALRDAYEMICSREATPPVIDATDLVADPPGILRAWSDSVGIKYMPESLTWDDGDCEAWGWKNLWEEFRERVMKSTGVIQSEPKPLPTLAEDVARKVDSLRPIYEALVANKVRATSH